MGLARLTPWMASLSAAVLCTASSGCAARSMTLIDPVSAATAKCSASSTGLVTGWADIFMSSCVKRYKNMGYVPLDELTPEQRAHLQRRGSLPAD